MATPPTTREWGNFDCNSSDDEEIKEVKVNSEIQAILGQKRRREDTETPVVLEGDREGGSSPIHEVVMSTPDEYSFLFEGHEFTDEPEPKRKAVENKVKCAIMRCSRYQRAQQPYPICGTHYDRSFQCIECGKWLLINSLDHNDGSRCRRCFDNWQQENGGAYPLEMKSTEIMSRHKLYNSTPNLFDITRTEFVELHTAFLLHH